MKAAVLLSCFNRKAKTLSCLKSLYTQSQVKDLELSVYLVDDGSTDGTRDAVTNLFPDVSILSGDGSLYWNGGMNMAWRAALDEGFDYYIWVNDDVVLRSDAFQVMFESLHQGYADCGKEPVVVGSFCENDSGIHAYGGFKVKRTPWGLSTKRISPNGALTRCDTFNGNFVLIPDSVVKVVGILDQRYRHAFGDKDYGFRCMRANIPMYITPDYVGHCSRNVVDGTWLDPMIPLRERYRKLRLPTGLPPGEYFYSYRKNSGYVSGLIALTKLYARLIFPELWSRLSKRESGE